MTMTNLARVLLDSVKMGADRPALRMGSYGGPGSGAVLTYGALDAASARVGAWLAREGVGPGDRVALMLPNVFEFAIVYYAILREGGVVVPMNGLLKEREVAYYLRDAGAKLLFAWRSPEADFAAAAEAGAKGSDARVVVVSPGSLDALTEAGVEPREATPRRAVDRAGNDTAILLYTSGTTGQPKGAELTHDNLVRNVEAAVRLFGLDADTVTLGVLPLFHAFGQTCGLNATLAAGGSLALVPRFDAAAVLRVLEKDNVHVFQGVPTMYTALLRDPGTFDTSSLRVAVSGGASLPVEILRGFEERYRCIILEGYGLSETSPIASFNHPDRVRVPGSIGTPIAGVEMKVVAPDGTDCPPGEVGEIVIRGHNVMKGYWNKPDATADAIRGGWFHSGDLARIDAAGNFFIVDRKKEMIIRGGLKVYPREIEELLYEHPAVAEAAVVAVPHETLGEEVGAAIVLRAGASSSADEIRDFAKARVAAYKYPRVVWFLPALPKGPTGKILKREITPP
jgi:long-chain acyl-CoA synthetase